jgi:predicted  nucleic acid-binding Zn-ribbon protein
MMKAINDLTSEMRIINQRLDQVAKNQATLETKVDQVVKNQATLDGNFTSLKKQLNDNYKAFAKMTVN